MNFKAHTKEELQELDLLENQMYTIKYLNKDYYNGEETVEIAKAKLILNENEYVFVVSDPYGMDRFINNVRVIL